MLRRNHFNQDHSIFRESVQKWADDILVPQIEISRANKQVDRSVWLSAGAQGYLCMWVPEEYGGLGITDLRFDQILTEELTRRDAGFSTFYHNNVVAPYIGRLGSEEQKRRYLPGMISGEILTSLAMTEPGAGSDVAGMQTRAEDRGDHWVLNGSKIYISHGQTADLYVVAAKTDPANPRAIGLFLVESTFQGFSRGRTLDKMGLQSADTAELFFDNCIVPKANQLGEANKGFKNMMLGLSEERVMSSVVFMARAQRAFEITLAFVKERRAFGKSIGQFQNTRFKMAEMRTEIDAAQTYLDASLMALLDGELTGEDAAAVKLLTSEVEGRVVDQCVQLHGGAGYMYEYEIARLFVDARISRIFAGTSEIMKEIIGRGLGLDDRTP